MRPTTTRVATGAGRQARRPGPTPRPPSRRVCAAAAMFGLALRRPARGCGGWGDAPASGRWAPRVARRVDRLLLPGQVALIVGPSGAGKTVLMRSLRRRLGGAGMVADAASLESLDHRVLADLDPAPLDVWLGYLARAGLAEARLLPRPVGRLSAGQRWRVMLALALSRAARSPRGRAVTVLADEFASVLDRLSARALARSIRRLVRPSSGLRLVAATAHDDLVEAMAPDVLVHVPLDASPEVLVP